MVFSGNYLALLVVMGAISCWTILYPSKEIKRQYDDFQYLETDPEYEYHLTDPNSLEIEARTAVSEQEAEQQYLTDALKTIYEQNMAYKAGNSSFYCGLTTLSGLGSHDMISLTGLIGEKPMYDSFYGDPTNSNEEPTYLKKALAKLGSPPNEFHTPKSNLTSVRDQKKCGSCVIFASVATIESAYLQKNPFLDNSKLDLAEQTLLNCAQEYSQDCEGTKELSTFFDHLVNNRGGNLPLESKHPYKGKQDKEDCPSQSENANVCLKVSDYFTIQNVGEEDLMALVAMHGAVMVGVDFHKLGEYARSYKGGVIDKCHYGDAKQNHAVTIVGYGVANGTKYWDVKNSWGENWGESGYFKMLRGTNCNRIEDVAVVPIITQAKCDMSTWKEIFFRITAW